MKHVVVAICYPRYKRAEGKLLQVKEAARNDVVMTLQIAAAGRNAVTFDCDRRLYAKRCKGGVVVA